MAQPFLVSILGKCELAGTDFGVAKLLHSGEPYRTTTVANAYNVDAKQHDVYAEPTLGAAPGLQRLDRTARPAARHRGGGELDAHQPRLTLQPQCVAGYDGQAHGLWQVVVLDPWRDGQPSR